MSIALNDVLNEMELEISERKMWAMVGLIANGQINLTDPTSRQAAIINAYKFADEAMAFKK